MIQSGSWRIGSLASGEMQSTRVYFNQSFRSTPVVCVTCGAANVSVHPDSVSSSGFSVQAYAPGAASTASGSWTAIGSS
ncbi:hypothetical protein CSQ85_00135 [Bifidobacterium rousetti]|nr:hypothetical protein CSQ85_00135 [Bifidobacterium rousetti]